MGEYTLHKNMGGKLILILDKTVEELWDTMEMAQCYSATVGLIGVITMTSGAVEQLNFAAKFHSSTIRSFCCPHLGKKKKNF